MPPCAAQSHCNAIFQPLNLTKCPQSPRLLSSLVLQAGSFHKRDYEFALSAQGCWGHKSGEEPQVTMISQDVPALSQKSFKLFLEGKPRSGSTSLVFPSLFFGVSYCERTEPISHLFHRDWELRASSMTHSYALS